MMTFRAKSHGKKHAIVGIKHSHNIANGLIFVKDLTFILFGFIIYAIEKLIKVKSFRCWCKLRNYVLF